LVSAADSNGKITSVLILVAVSRSCSWFACSGAPLAVLTVTLRPGCAFSRSFLAWLAQNTMPAVKLWVAAGMATPRLTLSACAEAMLETVKAAAAKASAVMRVRNFMMGRSPWWLGGKKEN
jgi:hypothetical protein